MADYFAHWLSFARRTDRKKLPKIFFVNWFRTGPDRKFLWPGYGENSRVLKWICERVEGTGKFTKTPIGNLPAADALDLAGLDLPDANLALLLKVDAPGWRQEVADVAAYYSRFNGKTPRELINQLNDLLLRLG
jgi:phosphoenolpyruvate carboxykinase (GTP)